MELWSADRVCIKGRFERDWGIMVDDEGVIQSIGPRDQLVANAKSVRQYSDHILLPAFINPHHIGFTRIFRGLFDFNASFQELRQKLVWPLSQAIDTELFEAVYRLALAEQALAGVASVGEFHYLHNGYFKEPGRGNFGELIISIARDMGLRLNLVYTFFDQGSSENTRAFIQPLDSSLEEFQSLFERYRNDPLVNVLPGVHSLEHTSSEAIIAAAELAEKYDTKFHVCLAERESELENARLQYGTTPLRALEKMGVLNDRLVVINGTHLDDEELHMLQGFENPMVICPSASLARGDDFPNTLGLIREEIPIAVGSSTIGMSNAYSVCNEIQWLEFSQRSLQKVMNVLCSQTDITSLWELGAGNGATALNLNPALLMPGSPADFMLVRISEVGFRPHFKYTDNRFLNQLIYGWGNQVQVTDLLVQGRPVVKNGYVCSDLTDSIYKTETWSQAVLRSMEKSAGKTAEEIPSETTP